MSTKEHYELNAIGTAIAGALGGVHISLSHTLSLILSLSSSGWL